MSNTVAQRGMTGTLKKFDGNVYRKNDTVAKNAFLKYLVELMPEFEHIENPDVHGIDLLTLQDGLVVACWELERREKNWVGDITFPFGDINCLERKDHQWRKAPTFTRHIDKPLAEDYNVYYVQMNDLCTRVAIIDGDTVLQHPLKEWRNRFVPEGEYVRQVPISKITQYKIA
jgi:hypothetical protein